jgi:hypothetical protein
MADDPTGQMNDFHVDFWGFRHFFLWILQHLVKFLAKSSGGYSGLTSFLQEKPK